MQGSPRSLCATRPEVQVCNHWCKCLPGLFEWRHMLACTSVQSLTAHVRLVCLTCVRLVGGPCKCSAVSVERVNALQDFFETRLLSMDTDFRVLSATHLGKLPGIDIAQVRRMAVSCRCYHRL